MALFYSGPWMIIELSHVPTLFKIEPHESWADGQSLKGRWATWDRLRKYHVDHESPTVLSPHQQQALQDCNDTDVPLESTPVLEAEDDDSPAEDGVNSEVEQEEEPAVEVPGDPADQPQPTQGRPKRARAPNVRLQGYADEQEMDDLIQVVQKTIES